MKEFSDFKVVPDGCLDGHAHQMLIQLTQRASCDSRESCVSMTQCVFDSSLTC